jgi:hypothetical protein
MRNRPEDTVPALTDSGRLRARLATSAVRKGCIPYNPQAAGHVRSAPL